MDENSLNRWGIGLLYAGGAGILLGTTLTYGTSPAVGWVIGAIVFVFGFVYELYERKRQKQPEIEW